MKIPVVTSNNLPTKKFKEVFGCVIGRPGNVPTEAGVLRAEMEAMVIVNEREIETGVKAIVSLCIPPEITSNRAHSRWLQGALYKGRAVMV